MMTPSDIVARQMGEHGVERLDIAELRVDIEQVPGDGAGDPVAHRLAHHDRAEALGDRILGRVPDAGGGP